MTVLSRGTGLGPGGRTQDLGTLGLRQTSVTPPDRTGCVLLAGPCFPQGPGDSSELKFPPWDQDESVHHLEHFVVCRFPKDALALSLCKRPGAMSLASHPSLPGNSSPRVGALGTSA